MRPLRIGVNALYLIPGGVGGTEIYLRHLLAALAEMDRANQYYVFTNLETGADLAPEQANFTTVRQRVNAAFRPARIIWEQTVLPLSAAARDIDVLFNPGFTGPLMCGRPQVTVFHDLQHKRHPEHFRWFELPFWRALLFWSAHLATLLIAVSEATRADLENYYRPNARVKNRDATTPIGPWIVDSVDVGDPQSLALSTTVNGAEVQHGSTADMILGVAGLIEYLSEFMTLMPGDMVLTGTPHGVHFVAAGDTVVSEIEKVGRLVNHVVAAA